MPSWRWPALAGKRRLLFMGRIDPVKGTLNLARAWGALAGRFPGWRLVVAGADWRGHRAAFEAAVRLDPSNELARRNQEAFEASLRVSRIRPTSGWEQKSVAAVRQFGLAERRYSFAA